MYSRFGAGLSSCDGSLQRRVFTKPFSTEILPRRISHNRREVFLLVFDYALGVMIRLSDSSVYAVADDVVDPSWSIRQRRLLNQRIGTPLRAPAKSMV